jgi:hypothetical protein
LTRNFFDTVIDADGRTRRVVSKTARQVTGANKLIFEYGLKSRPGEWTPTADWNPTRAQELVFGLRSRSRLFDLVAHRLYVYLEDAAYVEGQKQSFRDGSVGWEEVSSSLRKLADHTREHGVELHLTWIPWPKGIRGGEYLFEEEHERLQTLARDELEVPFHTVIDTVIDVPTEELVAHPQDAHLSPLGNELVGNRLAELMLPAVRVDIERSRGPGSH